MSKTKAWIQLSSLFFALSLAGTVHAATFNVANGTELQNALTQAQNNGEGDTIVLAAGNYDASTGTFGFTAAENFPLTLKGAGASTTILTGGDASQVMNLATDGLADDSNADIIVQDMTIQHGNSSSSGAGLLVVTNDADITLKNCSFLSNVSSDYAGGADLIAGNNGGAGNLSVDSNTFAHNTAPEAGAVEFIADAGGVVATNNIFFDNHALSTDSGAVLLQYFDTLGGQPLKFINNTVVGNSAATEGGGMFIFYAQLSDQIDLYNNIIFNNTAGTQGQDVFVSNEADAPFNLFNNDLTEICFEHGGCDPATVTAVSQGNEINVDPQLVDPANGNFNLSAGSKAIDAGDSNAPALPATDQAGNPRIIGSAPDLGALEALPGISVNPVTIDFGSVNLSDHKTVLITVTNTGAGLLDISNATLSDTVNYTLDITQGANPCGNLSGGLASGQSCTAAVIFNPTVNGTLNATLTLDSNDPQNPQFVVPLTGVGGGGKLISGSGCSLQSGTPAPWSGWLVLMLILPLGMLRAYRRQ